MTTKWVKAIKIVTTICSGIAMIGGAVTQSYEIKDAAMQAVKEMAKNKK